MVKLEITEFKFTSDSLIICFLSDFVVNGTLRFYIDQPGGILRCENKYMSREFVQAVLAKVGEHITLDGIGD